MHTSPQLAAVFVALYRRVASLSSSLTALPSAAYSRLRLRRVRVLLRVMAATDCRKCTRSASVLMSSVIVDSGENL